MGTTIKAIKKYNQGQLELAKQSNQWNAEQAQITREWQESMMNKQNDWSLAQWNRENEYNSPAAKAERLKEAGLNPAFGLGDADSASSIGSASAGQSPTPTAATPNLQPEIPDYQSMISGINSVFDQTGNVADHFLSFQAAPYQRAGLINGNFEWLSPQYQKLRQGYSVGFAHNAFAKDSQELYNMRMQGVQSTAAAAYTMQQYKSQQILNEYLPKEKQVEYYSRVATLDNLKREGLLKDAQYRKEVVNILNGLLDSEGKRISNRVSASIADSTISATNKANEYRVHEFKTWLKYGLPDKEAALKSLNATLESIKTRNQLDMRGHDGYGRKRKGFANDVGSFVGSLLDAADMVIDPLKGIFGFAK